jgi:hypothetical protein
MAVKKRSTTVPPSSGYTTSLAPDYPGTGQSSARMVIAMRYLLAVLLRQSRCLQR